MSTILVSRNVRCMRIFAGFLRKVASKDCGVVDDDIFGYFGGYFGQHCLQTKISKKAVLWQGNRTMPL